MYCYKRDNKIRLNYAGRLRKVKVGFKNENDGRHLVNGKKVIMIYNVADLKKIVEGCVGIIGKIGNKNKKAIADHVVKNKVELFRFDAKKFLDRLDKKMKEAKDKKDKRKSDKIARDKKAKADEEKAKKEAEKKKANEEKKKDKLEEKIDDISYMSTLKDRIVEREEKLLKESDMKNDEITILQLKIDKAIEEEVELRNKLKEVQKKIEKQMYGNKKKK